MHRHNFKHITLVRTEIEAAVSFRCAFDLIVDADGAQPTGSGSTEQIIAEAWRDPGLDGVATDRRIAASHQIHLKRAT